MGLAKSDIQMDVGKAMQILGFPYQQTFESTSSDDITTAFLTQTKRVMKKRQDALEKEKSKVASGYQIQRSVKEMIIFRIYGTSRKEIDFPAKPLYFKGLK